MGGAGHLRAGVINRKDPVATSHWGRAVIARIPWTRSQKLLARLCSNLTVLYPLL
jgi:hypothetical protein